MVNFNLGSAVAAGGAGGVAARKYSWPHPLPHELTQVNSAF